MSGAPAAAESPLTAREQKRRVARALLVQAGSLVEFWSEDPHSEGVDAEFARECLARWMKALPGDDWDLRLGDPNKA
ncbi:hypothetical protein ABZT26_36060 [Streptomyces sp. NPDC005395]|uniref:hypothetical protein n=1 Tax=Streptomyces sp. NPDC005395 TaxID=3157042 RepID=UPI0033AD1DBA